MAAGRTYQSRTKRYRARLTARQAPLGARGTPIVSLDRSEDLTISTGMRHTSKTAWRSQQRHRLSYLAHNETGTRQIYAAQPDGGYKLETWDVRDLVEKYTDIGMVGGPTFCTDKDGTCKELQDEVHWA